VKTSFAEVLVAMGKELSRWRATPARFCSGSRANNAFFDDFGRTVPLQKRTPFRTLKQITLSASLIMAASTERASPEDVSAV